MSSDTGVVTFSYGLEKGDRDNDGVVVPAGSLTYDAGTTLKGLGPHGQDAVPTHDEYEFPEHLVNVPPPVPEILDIDVVSSPGSDGTYATGDHILVDVRFSAPVFAEGNHGAIALNLEVGDAVKQAGYVGGTGADTLKLLYEVKEDDADGDGVRVPEDALSLGTGVTLKDAAKQDADLTHRAYGPFESHRVNAPLAEIVDIEVVSAVPDIGFHASSLGHRVRFRVTFSRPVTVIAYGGGVARLTVRVGEDDVMARYVRGNGSRELDFDLALGAEHTDTDGLSVPDGALTLAGPMLLRDADGRDAVLTHGAYGPFDGHKVNTLPPPPHITGITEVSDPPEDRTFYFTGDTIRVRVTFNAPVTETRPASGETGAMLTLGVGDARVQAKAVIEGSTATPEFHYTVRADDLDADGVSVPGNALTLAEGARLEGPYGQAAVLTHEAPVLVARHTVNTPLPPPPHITGIEVVVGRARCRVLRVTAHRWRAVLPDRVRGDVQRGQGDLRRDQRRVSVGLKVLVGETETR